MRNALVPSVFVPMMCRVRRDCVKAAVVRSNRIGSATAECRDCQPALQSDCCEALPDGEEWAIASPSIRLSV